MPRIRQLAEKYAEDDQKKVEKAFWKSVKVRCAEQDIDTWADLGQQTGIPESTFQNYRANIGKVQINTMRKINVTYPVQTMCGVRYFGSMDFGGRRSRMNSLTATPWAILSGNIRRAPTLSP